LLDHVKAVNGFGERPSVLTFRDLTEKNRHLDIQVTVFLSLRTAR
jgi:hypothetical protein